MTWPPARSPPYCVTVCVGTPVFVRTTLAQLSIYLNFFFISFHFKDIYTLQENNLAVILRCIAIREDG